MPEAGEGSRGSETPGGASPDPAAGGARGELGRTSTESSAGAEQGERRPSLEQPPEGLTDEQRAKALAETPPGLTAEVVGDRVYRNPLEVGDPSARAVAEPGRLTVAFEPDDIYKDSPERVLPSTETAAEPRPKETPAPTPARGPEPDGERPPDEPRPEPLPRSVEIARVDAFMQDLKERVGPPSTDDHGNRTGISDYQAVRHDPGTLEQYAVYAKVHTVDRFSSALGRGGDREVERAQWVRLGYYWPSDGKFMSERQRAGASIVSEGLGPIQYAVDVVAATGIGRALYRAGAAAVAKRGAETVARGEARAEAAAASSRPRDAALKQEHADYDARVLGGRMDELNNAAVRIANGIEQGRPIQQLVTDVNPLRYGSNCNECAKAVDNILAGRAGVAGAGGTETLATIEAQLGLIGEFTRMNIRGIKSELASPGSRGLVYVSDGTVAHVFNGANIGGRITFIDGQVAAVGSFAQVMQANGWSAIPGIVMRFLRTTP